MPIADPGEADYHIDGEVNADEPEIYAQKAFAFFLHEIAKQSDDTDDALSTDYFASTMVLGRVHALLAADPPLVEHAIALIEHHERYESPEPEGDLPSAADMLK